MRLKIHSSSLTTRTILDMTKTFNVVGQLLRLTTMLSLYGLQALNLKKMNCVHMILLR